VRPEHRQSFRVRSYETDPYGRLQAQILCKLLQEAATVHAAKLGVAVETLIEEGVAWVLSHLRLEVERWPGPETEIVVRTWPEAANRLFTERRFEVVDAAGDRLAAASSLWLVLDLERRRPVRFPAVVLEALAKHELGSEPMKSPRLAAPEPADRELAFTVRRSDLDLAGHVNNTSYVEWAVEAVPDRVWSSCELAELEISFLSECHQGQTVVSSSQTAEAGGASEVRHEIARREDGEEVARARSVWLPRL
jgi:medium-chain acyl-[acyl-carrier-protein] hydrolase